MKILITDGGTKHTLGILRYLSKNGHYVGVTSSQRFRTPCFASKFCRKKYTLPKNEGEQLNCFLSILEKDKYDLIIPIGYPSTLFCAKHKKRLSRYSSLVLSDYEKIKFSADKSNIYTLAQKLNVPTPTTADIHSLEELEAVSNRMIFPLVLKAKGELGEHLVEYANDKQNLFNKYNKAVNDSRLNSGESLLLQDYIKGPGFGFFAFYINGQLKNYFMHKRIREYPISGGASVLAKSIHNKKVFEYGKKILDALQWHGVAMVEFKYDINKKDYYLMEVNPKFWGSHDLSLSSGIEFPQYIIDYVNNNELKPYNNYPPNFYFLWPFSGMVQNIIKHPSDILFLLHIIISKTVKTNIDLQDIKPNLVELLNNISKMGKEVLTWFKR